MKGEKERMATTTSGIVADSILWLHSSIRGWSDLSLFSALFTFFAQCLGIVTVLLCYSFCIRNKHFVILYNFAIHLSKAKKGLLKYPHFAIKFSHMWISFPPSYFNDSHSSNFPYLYHREIGRPPAASEEEEEEETCSPLIGWGDRVATLGGNLEKKLKC